jgi:hypothetical protein
MDGALCARPTHVACGVPHLMCRGGFWNKTMEQIDAKHIRTIQAKICGGVDDQKAAEATWLPCTNQKRKLDNRHQ